MAEERRIQLVAEVDTTETRDGFVRIGQQADQMARDVSRAGERAQSSVGGIGNGADASARRVEGAQRNLIQAIQRTSAQMEAGSRTSARYFEVLARQRGVDPTTLEPYIRQLRQVELAQERASESAVDAASVIKGAFGSLIASLSIAGFAQQVMSAQREFDKLNASLTTATGSAAGAALAFNALQKFASTTPFSVQEATEGFIKLRNMGLDPSERALRAYGNTAAAMGKSLNQMVEAVADAATGEFERLKEFGIRASKDGEKVTLTFKGMSTTVRDSATEIEGYLRTIGEVDFASAMSQRAATLDGAISNLGDSWAATMRAVSSSGLGESAQAGVIGLTGALTDLQTILNAITAAADKQGKSLSQVSLIHTGLTTVFEAVSVLGVNVAYVFTQVGREIGGLAAQAAAVARGEFAQARAIGEMMKADADRDRKEVDAKTEAILGAVEQAKKAAAQLPTASSTDTLAQFQTKRQREKESEEASKKREAQLRREAATLAELSGVSTDYMSKLAELQSIRARGNISEERYVELVTELISKQPAAKKWIDGQAKSHDDLKKALDSGRDARDRDIRSIDEQTAALKLKVMTYGLLPEAITEVQIAELEASKQSLVLTDEGVADVQRKIDALKRLKDQQFAFQGKDAAADAAKKAEEDWKRAADSIEQSLTDALLRGFESGKSFGKNLIDTLKNMFNTLVLRPVISAVVNPVAGALTSGLGLAGTAQAATPGGSALSNAGSLFRGIGAMSGSFGTGLMSGLSAWGAEGSVMGLLNSGALFGGGIANGLGAIAGALGPIALGLGAAVAIWKKLDTSGTYHTGGASSATGNAVTTIRAESLNFEKTRTNAETEAFTGALSLGIVKILDSAATAFGKTAGFTAATAFADDTSKDGAWGGLRITQGMQKILDWQDTKAGDWAPKTFADGEAGQKQYLEALSKSVRVALDGIGLPSWATSMLDSVGEAASIEELAKVVDGINATQSALKVMGDRLIGFSSLTDTAVSALMKAAGGIESLASGASAYYDNFYSEEEKAAAAQKQIADALKAVNLVVPATRDEYRALVEQQLALGEGGAAATAALLKNAGAFAELHPVLEATSAAADKAAAVLQERKTLQDRYDELTMTSAQLREKERNALDESNRALYDQIQAILIGREAIDRASQTSAAAVDRYEAATSAARSFMDSLVGSADRAKDAAHALRDFNDAMKIGDLSPLSKDAQYTLAKSQLQAASPETLQAAANTFLRASKDRDAGSLAYARDFALVQQLVDKAADAEELRASQIEWIASLFSRRALGMDGSHANGLDYVPFDGYRAVLHRGERVQTAAEARGSDALTAAVERLVAENDEMRDGINAIAKHTMNTAERLDELVNGERPISTKVVTA